MQADDRRDDQGHEEPGDRHDHERAASELSDRAAESVGRRYDATKETVHEARSEDRPDDATD